MAYNVRQGNPMTIIIQLTDNDDPVGSLGLAESITVNLLDSTGVVCVSGTPGATLAVDSPALGSLTWTILSAETETLELDYYTLAVQVVSDSGTKVIEWAEPKCIRLVRQFMPIGGD